MEDARVACTCELTLEEKQDIRERDRNVTLISEKHIRIRLSLSTLDSCVNLSCSRCFVYILFEGRWRLFIAACS